MDKMNGKSSLKSLFFLKWGSVIIREIAKYYLDVYTYLLLIASSVWTLSDGFYMYCILSFNGVLRHFQYYYSYIVAGSVIGGGKRRTSPTCPKSLTNFIT